MKENNVLIEQYELVTESHYIFENIPPKIKSRIYRIIVGANAKFMWDINYYCRISGEAQVYTPGGPFGDSLEEIKHKLDEYIQRFKKAEEWSENESFMC